MLMGFRETLDRRDLTKIAAGVAAGAALGPPALASAQNAQATSDAAATATVEAEGVQVSTEIEGKINVTWWTHNNPAFVNGNNALIAAFEAANPDIHIVYQYFPYDVFTQKLQTGYASGTVADVQQMFGTWVTEYARNQLLDPVPDEMAATMGDRFWPAATGAYQLDGKYYGQPKEYNLENGGILINPALLAEGGVTESPTSWQELIDSAVKVTKHDENGLLTQAGFAYINNDTITFTYLSMILQQGANYFQDDGTHVNLTSDEATKAWQDLTDLATKYKVDSSQAYSGDTEELFFRGGAAMCAKGPWAIAYGLELYPGFEFRYDPMPVYAGTELKFAAESGWGEVVNAKASDEKKEAAWKFIDFMGQEDQAREWNKATFTVPALQSLNNDPALLEAAPGLATSFAILPYGQWVGLVGDRDRFWEYVRDAFSNVELGLLSVEESLSACEEQINAMIDENMGP
jgi:multiple sugar transport system substrate-binding protein